MSQFVNYENIPGMPVTFKNDNLSNSNSLVYSTKSLLILGTSEDGPVMEPVQVDLNTIKMFGRCSKGNGIPNNSTLITDFYHAYDVGCRDIRLMRITGKEASTEIKTIENAVVNVNKTEENKGIVGGNDETVISLVNTPIDSSVKIYCKGVLVPKGYTVSGKTLTISKNACDAGAIISVMYSYYKDSVKEEYVTIAENKTIALTETPKAGAEITVSVNNIQLVKNTDYTVSGKTITITKSSVEAGVEAKIKYTYTLTSPTNVSENNNGVLTYITSYTNKTFELLQKPVEGSIRIYISNKEISNIDAYVITKANNITSITIDKKYFSKNEPIQVSYLYEELSKSANSIKISTINGGEIYNQSKVSVTTINNVEEGYYDKIISFIKPESKKSSVTEEPLTYKASEYPTFMALVNAINSDRNNNVFKASTDNPNALTIDVLEIDTFFNGGDNGLNCTKQELFDNLSGVRDSEGYIAKQGAYQILENYIVDIVVPGGVYSDDYVAGRNKDFAYELSLLCAIITNRTKTVLGVIPTRPCTDTSLVGVQEHTNKLLKYNNTYPLRDENGNLVLDAENQLIDIGRHVHVVVGPEPLVFNNELGIIVGNPAIQYAAELTLLPAQSSPLNKNLHGIRGLRYSYQTPQIDKLLENRYVMFNSKLNKSRKTIYKIVDGVTCAFKGSKYARTTTLRCLQEIIDEFRDAADPFLGEPPSVENRNALASAISKRKDILVEQGVAEDISFQLVVTQQDYLLGQASLEIDVVPPKEFRKINMVVGLKNTI